MGSVLERSKWTIGAERCRSAREAHRQRHVLTSLAESGQQTPIVVVVAPDNSETLPGNRRPQTHCRAPATGPRHRRSHGLAMSETEAQCCALFSLLEQRKTAIERALAALSEVTPRYLRP